MREIWISSLKDSVVFVCKRGVLIPCKIRVVKVYSESLQKRGKFFRSAVYRVFEEVKI